MIQGFLLGLGNGATCVAYCSPVLLPYMLGKADRMGQNLLTLAQFLAGRLAGYLVFGTLAWLAGQQLTGLAQRKAVLGPVYLVLAMLLIVYGFTTPKISCAAETAGGLLGRLSARWPAILPVMLGFLTGLNLCPPFLGALAGTASSTTLSGSLLFMLLFFLGTTVFFIPFPLVGALRRLKPLVIVGRLAAGIVGLYYLYLGIVMLYGVSHQ